MRISSAQLSFLVSTASLVQGQTPTLPGFNIFPVRNLVVTGLFDGLTFLPNNSQSAIPPFRSIPTGIYSRHNGTLDLIGNLSGGGDISGFCTLTVDDEYFLYVGGSFSMINDKRRLNNVAMFDLQTKQWSSLSNGLKNNVLSIACDNQRQSVLFGTNFLPAGNGKPEPQSGGIFQWYHSNKEWIPLSFKGVNGPVNTITHRTNNNNVIIGGKFSSTLDGVMSSSPLSNQIDLHDVNIEIHAARNRVTDDPDRLLCDNDKSFDMVDGATGDIIFTFPPKVIPSGIRIWNSDNNNGLEKIQILTYPDNLGIPISKITPNGRKDCGTEACWLDRTDQPQEFIFYNTDIKMSNFKLKMVSHYGQRVSIKKLEVFSYNSYAPTYHTRSKLDYCQSYQPEGPKVFTSLIQQPSASPNLPDTMIKTLSYRPNLMESGHYKISLHKAATCPSPSCHQLSLVDIKISPAFTDLGEVIDPITKKKSISDSLTEVHTGYFDKSELNPTEITVSYSYYKDDTKTIDPIAGIIIEKTVIQNNLPNLLEFVPFSPHSNQSGVIDGFSHINNPVLEVTALATDQETLYIGGKFDGLPHVAQVDSNYNILLKGHRGDVKGLAVTNNTLYVGGSLALYRHESATFLGNLMQLDLSLPSSEWTIVANIITKTPVTSFYHIPSTPNILMTGQFNANRDDTIIVPQLHYLEYNAQLKNVSSYAFMEGDISSVAYQSASEPWTFFAGRIRKKEYVRATNVAYLTENGSVMPIAATPDNMKNSVLQTAELNTGLMYIPHLTNPNDKEPLSNPPLVVVGGKHVPDKFPGVGIYDGKQWRFLNVGQGQVKTLACSDNELFIGGDFDGGSGNQRLLVYSFKSNQFNFLTSPLSSAADNRVNKMVRQYGTTKIIVAGQFDAPTGNSDCNNLCLLDADLKSWTVLEKQLPAEIQEVVDIVSYDNRIVLSSKKMNPDNELYLYDVAAQSWSQTSLNLPGFPQYLSYDNATRGLFISGKTDDGQSSFIYWWNEVKSRKLGEELRNSPHIKEIMVLEKPLTAYDELNLDFKLPPQGAILVSGELMLEGFGACSGALFNGTVWKPYFTSSLFKDNDIVPGQASVFRLMPFFPRQREYLSTLYIILISLGIALGVLILIIAMGLILLFFQHKRRQRSRQALVPLLSDVGSVDPTAITSPLASPINPAHPPNPMLSRGDEMDTTMVNPIPMQERHTVARTSSNVFPNSGAS